jgi:hypothetical protein
MKSLAIIMLTLHMVRLGIFSYKCKIILTFYLNFFSMITQLSSCFQIINLHLFQPLIVDLHLVN